MANFDYTDLTIQVRRDPEQGLVFFGVVVEGAWIVLGSRKLGGFDAKLAEAASVQAEQQQTQTASAPPPGPDETPPPPAQ